MTYDQANFIKNNINYANISWVSSFGTPMEDVTDKIFQVEIPKDAEAHFFDTLKKLNLKDIGIEPEYLGINTENNKLVIY